jgi:hypothetical protein
MVFFKFFKNKYEIQVLIITLHEISQIFFRNGTLFVNFDIINNVFMIFFFQFFSILEIVLRLDAIKYRFI